MSNADLIERLNEGVADTGVLIKSAANVNATMREAADALEAADKRIAELEAGLQQRAKQIGVACNKHDLTHSLACGRCLTEAKRKLAVAREALKAVICWSELRTIENIIHKTDLAGECVQIRLTGLKTCAQALAQIGEK